MRTDLVQIEDHNNPELHMIFCMLDTATPYDIVCRAFSALKAHGIVNRDNIKLARKDKIEQILRSVGYRWPKQKSIYLWDFAYNPIDITTATRDELTKNIKGIGMKLASLFVRNTRKERVAVIDVHIKRWLVKTDISSGFSKNTPYKKWEELFLRISDNLHKDPAELDYLIWERYRRKPRSG